ncbi:TonB-dependent siderophore receptor [Lonepinella koalarum]|uniref:Iron complex outermembrane receptor protein n=1 Tax=Lonepinella koalarum TaxID=53417 RepID=A0A4R1L0V2_9PAST|nr:TonB-dependent siderophore receptor [Lonepinella koalarum]MDH2926878.1 ligand-gated channel protein [Lonepinella koalarum]TCK70463.1 iron complex outermembrane receptor protein [Lonepinella koalarum]TFJ90150.1 TonB-dependent siderophore receptor [Lonepinella koalarum]
MKLKFSLIYTALFAGVSFGTFAETGQQRGGNEELEEIQVTSGELKQIGYHAMGTSAVSKVDVPIIDTPTTVNVVTSKLIEDRKPNDLIDALSSVSGVSQANTLGGIFDAVQKRGFGGNRDNSIMRNGSQAGPSHNFGATTETVEVLKGPTSVLYGIQDPGGVINVVTKKPQQEQKTIIGGTVGNNNMWGTQFDSTGSLGNGFAYRFIYDKQEKDYWRNFGEIKSTTYAPSISYENDNTKVLVAYEHLDYTQPFDRGTQIVNGSVVNIPAERRLDEPNNQTTGKTDNIQVKLEQKLNDHWKLNATYGYARDKYNYRQTRVVAVNTSETDTLNYSSTRILQPRTALRRLEKQAADQRIHSGSLNLVGEFSIGEIANRFIIGADASRNYRTTGPVFNNGGWSFINIDNPTYTNPDVTETVAANNWQINNIKTLGVYVQDTAYLTDSLIVTGGLRYEYFDQVAGRHALNATLVPNTDQHDGKMLYQFGSVYKFTPNLAVYANYAESFRPQYAIANAVDPNLPAEQGKSIEIGTKYESSNINATLALFNINKKNVAETDANNNLYIAGKQRSRGIEVDINGYITDKLSASLTYTYTKVENRQNDSFPSAVGKQLIGVPKHQGALFLSYDLGNFLGGDWRIGGGARYLGSWHAYDSSYTTSYKIPDATIYDAFLAYETKLASKKVSLQLNGKNLSDKVYYQSTAGNIDTFITPISLGYGREYLLNAKIEF